MKKFFKALLIIIFVLLLALAALAFYAYRLANNADAYSDRYVDYQSGLEEYADSRFEDFMYYDRSDNRYSYAVPFVLLYDTVNIGSMSSFLSLPEELKIVRMGMVPDLEDKRIDIYLDVRVRELFDTCLIIKTVYDVSQDGKRLEMRFDDFSVINDKVTEWIKKQVEISRGTLMFTQDFPVFVAYYQMPYFDPGFVSDVRYEDGKVMAVYDLKSALIDYLSKNSDHPLNQKLEAIDLEMRKAGIAHSGY